jgi:hypothetical protein
MTKRGKTDYLTADERLALTAAIRAGWRTKDIAAKFNIAPRTVNLYQAGVHGRAKTSRAGRQDANGGFVRRLCIIAGCDSVVDSGERRCGQHRAIGPVLPTSEFVRPPTLARLMAGR